MIRSVMRSVFRRAPRLVAGFAAGCALLAPRAAAHDGPPYPIFVDEDVGGWTVSIWTDPDVGVGTFYYYVVGPAGDPSTDLAVRVSSSPQDGRSEEVTAVSVLAEPGEPFQLVGELPFHHRGLWDTRFAFERAGGDVVGELSYELDVTPPGLGAFDLVWFAFPFLALGGLWLRALLAQRAHDREEGRSAGRDGAPDAA